MKKRAFLFLGILTLLTPLGLLSNYSAWGEWENSYYEKVLGFIPKGIENAKGLKVLIPDYSLFGFGEVFSYYFSAFVGIVLIFILLYIFSKSGKNANSQ